MSDSPGADRPYDLRSIAAIIALALTMIGGALILYYLLDLLLIFFLGIVMAAALQPAHLWLARWGVPKAVAVLSIYALFLLTITLLGLFVGPVLFTQLTTFVEGLPQRYSQFLHDSHSSSNMFLREISARLPSFNAITQQLSNNMPAFVGNLLSLFTSAVSFFTYFIVVLAIGFYWTMEVPRWERVIVSLAPTSRRQQILDIWHEIEYKLGNFIRGQGLAMLTMGAASAIGYWLIGLPNVFVVAVLAGLFEALPIIGPVLGVVPALLVASPLGLSSVLLVIGYATLMQLFESNVLIPHIMSKTVGISSLVGLFAVLALGTLYGVLGAFIGIPITVVLQVLLEHLLVNPEPIHQTPLVQARPFEVLRVRLNGVRQQLRERFRDRSARVQTDNPPQTVDQVADQVEHELEKAVEHAEAILSTAQHASPTMDADAQQLLVSDLEQTARTLEQSVVQVEKSLPSMKGEETLSDQQPSAATNLQRVTQQAKAVVASAENTLSEVQKNPDAQQPPDSSQSEEETKKHSIS